MTQFTFDNPVLDPLLPGSILGRLARSGGVDAPVIWWPADEQHINVEFLVRRLVIRTANGRCFINHLRAATTLRELGLRDCWWATRQLDERLSRSVNFWAGCWPTLLGGAHKVVMTGPPEVLEQFRAFVRESVPEWRARVSLCQLVLQGTVLMRFRAAHKLIDFSAPGR
jgi:hypothetical protein